MKVQVNRKELLKAIDAVKLSIPSNLRCYMLKYIVVNVENNRVTVTATDLETTIKAWVHCNSEDVGELLLPAKEFRKFVAAVDDCNEIKIEVDSGEIVLKANQHIATFRICTDDYVPIPSFESSYSTCILNLADQLKKIDWNMAVDSTRPVLSSVYFTGETLVAADGFTLGIVPVQIEGKSKKCDLIIPSGAISKIIKLKMNVVELEFALLGNVKFVRVTKENVELTTICVQGTYPDYLRMMLEDNPNNITLSSKALLRSVRAMRIVDSMSTIKLESHENVLRIWKQNPDSEIAVQSSVKAQGVLKIALDDVFLFNALIRCKGNLSISSSNATSSVTVRNSDSIWVIMPVFLRW